MNLRRKGLRQESRVIGKAIDQLTKALDQIPDLTYEIIVAFCSGIEIKSTGRNSAAGREEYRLKK
jgi:hypothetical protein